MCLKNKNKKQKQTNKQKQKQKTKTKNKTKQNLHRSLRSNCVRVPILLPKKSFHTLKQLS